MYNVLWRSFWLTNFNKKSIQKFPKVLNKPGGKIDTKQPAEIDRTFFGRATADLSFDNCTVWLESHFVFVYFRFDYEDNILTQ